ncbi:hypothetical protein pipiens_010530 [Culex pipiens pipiens]|uniref:Uncharacterized protein n=1 Tax=Culex pipiens pipiens TaxID=38569 RepID=A0ABD1D9R7_CULPP
MRCTEDGTWLRTYLANAPPFLESLEGAQYSVALMATIVCAEIFAQIPRYGPLEATMSADFVSVKTWREGHVKKSFVYLLIDPRITDNMTTQQDLGEQERWRKFISSIFYVGKGKSGRPYAHLHDAMKLLRERSDRGTDRKLDRILEIWGAQRGCGRRLPANVS